MGMYTELIFGATLKEKTPTYVTQALDWVINDNVDGKEFDYYKFTVGPGQGVYINYKFTEEKIRELLTHI